MKAESKHKINMNPTMKDLRSLFKKIEPNEYNQELIKQLAKPERAEMVFRFHLAGFKIATLCNLYGISPGYQRELRQLKEQDWAMNMLNCDEEFVQFLKEYNTKHPDIKEDSLESLALRLVVSGYTLVGCSEMTNEEFMNECDKVLKLFSEEVETKTNKPA